MPKLMKQVVNGYTAYYNHKYQHQGQVFCGRYKAIELKIDEVSDLIRYMHIEPKDKNYEWSSFARYLGKESFLNCDISLFMDRFGTLENVVKFHEGSADYQASLKKIKSPVCLG